MKFLPATCSNIRNYVGQPPSSSQNMFMECRRYQIGFHKFFQLHVLRTISTCADTCHSSIHYNWSKQPYSYSEHVTRVTPFPIRSLTHMWWSACTKGRGVAGVGQGVGSCACLNKVVLSVFLPFQLKELVCESQCG